MLRDRCAAVAGGCGSRNRTSTSPARLRNRVAPRIEARSERGAVTQRTILVVEDEEAIAQAIEARLRSEGYDVVVAPDGPAALAQVDRARPDLVVLDLMLPGIDGLEVCSRIQAAGWVPVIMVTARAEEADKVAGLGVGADDYITKPFSMRELAARVAAIFRRIERIQAAGDSAPIVRGDLRVDPARRRVFAGGDEIQLTPIEFEILRTLAERPGLVLERDRLMDLVWGYTDHTGGRVVDSHVARVRKKIGDDVAAPRYIRTVHGVGYAFCEAPATGS